jgi:hypothetical protein
LRPARTALIDPYDTGTAGGARDERLRDACQRLIDSSTSELIDADLNPGQHDPGEIEKSGANVKDILGISGTLTTYSAKNPATFVNGTAAEPPICLARRSHSGIAFASEEKDRLDT